MKGNGMRKSGCLGCLILGLKGEKGNGVRRQPRKGCFPKT